MEPAGAAFWKQNLLPANNEGCASAQPAFTSGLKPSAFRAADGRRIRSGMPFVITESDESSYLRSERDGRTGCPARVPARLLSRTTAPTFRQKDMEIGRRRLAGKLAHHQRNLTSMVSGMVCQMLHQVRQADVCCAEREHSL
jgi:hypothetical protein